MRKTGQTILLKGNFIKTVIIMVQVNWNLFYSILIHYYSIFAENRILPTYTVKPVLSSHSKVDQKLVFKTDYLLMQIKSIAECSKGSILQLILSTFIKLPYVIKIFVLSVFEWPLKTGFTVY